MSRFVFILVSMLPLLAARGEAQVIPCSGGPCLRPRAAGTHFLVEVSGGGTLIGGRGPAVGGMLGVGGALRGLPLRFYLVGELAYLSSTESGASSLIPDGFRDARSQRDLALGLRVYLPIYGGLRLFADALGGGSYHAGSIEGPGLPTRSSSGWAPLGVFATGLQVRFIQQLAVGLRVRFTLSRDELDGLREAMGDAATRPVSFMAGLTWHF
jgi:hypothetical protein